MSYTLGYYPTAAEFDGRYRKIQVRIRRAGLKANHRKGYYALDERAVKHMDAAAEMREAARDPLDSGIVGIDGQLAMADGKAKAILRVDVAELLWPAGSEQAVHAAVGIFQFDAEGRALKSFVDNVKFTIDNQRASLLAQHGMSYNRYFALEPGVARVRVVVRSARTGSIGSLELPLPKPAS